jgi:ABC-2 type transport system permease protein
VSALHAELLAVRKRPGVWVIGGAWACMAVGFGIVVPYIVWLAVRHHPTGSAGDPEKILRALLPGEFVSSTVGLYPLFGAALMLIFGAVITGGDYRWGTWGTLLVQRPGRATTVVAKAAATAVVLLCVSVVVMAATAAGSALVAAVTGRAAHWPSVVTVLGGIGAAWLVSMAAASLGGFLAVLLRGPGAAIGVGLLWLLALETLVSGLASTLPALKAVQRLLIGPSGGSLATALAPGNHVDNAAPGLVSVSGPLTGAVVLAAYVVVFVGLSAVLVSRRDTS